MVLVERGAAYGIGQGAGDTLMQKMFTQFIQKYNKYKPKKKNIFMNKNQANPKYLHQKLKALSPPLLWTYWPLRK